MKSYSSKDLLDMLIKDGWVLKNQRGSHVQMVHPSKPGKVTVLHPRRDLNPKTVKSILRQAGLDQSDHQEG
jgi:predicted RNA binding protein YcfA (HicA-like mRNA interferase family)